MLVSSGLRQWSCGVKASLWRENGAFIWHALPHFLESHKTCFERLAVEPHTRSPESSAHKPTKTDNPDAREMDGSRSRRTDFPRKVIQSLSRDWAVRWLKGLLSSAAPPLGICLCYRQLALNHPPGLCAACCKSSGPPFIETWQAQIFSKQQLQSPHNCLFLKGKSGRLGFFMSFLQWRPRSVADRHLPSLALRLLLDPAARKTDHRQIREGKHERTLNTREWRSFRCVATEWHRRHLRDWTLARQAAAQWRHANEVIKLQKRGSVNTLRGSSQAGTWNNIPSVSQWQEAI